MTEKRDEDRRKGDRRNGKERRSNEERLCLTCKKPCYPNFFYCKSCHRNVKDPGLTVQKGNPRTMTPNSIFSYNDSKGGA